MKVYRLYTLLLQILLTSCTHPPRVKLRTIDRPNWVAAEYAPNHWRVLVKEGPQFEAEMMKEFCNQRYICISGERATIIWIERVEKKKR